jgi:hypothetical protein
LKNLLVQTKFYWFSSWGLPSFTGSHREDCQVLLVLIVRTAKFYWFSSWGLPSFTGSHREDCQVRFHTLPLCLFLRVMLLFILAGCWGHPYPMFILAGRWGHPFPMNIFYHFYFSSLTVIVGITVFLVRVEFKIMY